MAWREEERFDQFGVELPFAPGTRRQAAPEPAAIVSESPFVADHEELGWLEGETGFLDEEWADLWEAEEDASGECECETVDFAREDEIDWENEVDFEGEWTDLLPALTAEDALAQTLYGSDVRTRLELPLLDSARAAIAAKWNRARHPSKSAIDPATLLGRLDRYVDTAAIERAIKANGELSAIAKDAYAVLSVAAHQFQKKIYAAPRPGKRARDPRDGIIGEGTLDALGFLRHRDKSLNTVDQSNVASHVARKSPAYLRVGQLFKSDQLLFQALGGDVTAKNWFYLYGNPPFLGRPFRNGVHIELIRRLRLAEAWLMAQPRYRGMSPAQIGNLLQIDEDHAGGRPTQNTSMHTLGLAVDIGYIKNPWIAGQHGNEHRNATFHAVTRNASLLMAGQDVPLTPGWLSKWGNKAGGTTDEAFTAIHDRHVQLVDYLALRKDQAALLAAIQRRAATGGPNLAKVIKPGEITEVAASRWRQTIESDYQSLRGALAGQGLVRDPDLGFLNLHRDLVIALRDHGCLAWGAIDLGGECGDIMHFDCRPSGLGLALAIRQQRTTGKNHPCYSAMASENEAEAEVDEESASKPALRPQAVDGKLWAFTATSLPLRVGIYVPTAAIANLDQVELLVYGHGLLAPCKPIPQKMPDDLFTKAPFRLAQIISRSGRATVLVVPSLEWPRVTAGKLGFGHNGRQHRLGQPALFNAVMDEVLGEIGRQLGTPQPHASKLIVSGHSRAYDLLDPLAAGHADPAMTQGVLAKLTGIWALDTAYSAPVKDYLALLAVKPQLRIEVLFRCGSDTESGGLAFDKAVVGTAGRLRVSAVCEAHCSVPVRRLPQLLDSLPKSNVGLDQREVFDDERFAWQESDEDSNFSAEQSDFEEQYDLEAEEFDAADFAADEFEEGAFDEFAWQGESADEAGSEECENGDWESNLEESAGEVLAKPPFVINKLGKGFKSHGGDKVETVLRRLVDSGKLAIASDDIAVLERLSRVESSGFIACVQTYDSAYLSFGFMQYTILYGELQELISKIPDAFARYGIVLEGTYTIGKRTVRGIRDAARAADLRASLWVDRFMRAGFDDEINAAQAKMGLADVSKLTLRLRRIMGTKWSDALASARVRALVAEAHNNRPVVMWGAKGVKGAAAMVAAGFTAGSGEPAFVKLLVSAIHQAYSLRGEIEKGQRLTSKILF